MRRETLAATAAEAMARPWAISRVGEQDSQTVWVGEEGGSGVGNWSGWEGEGGRREARGM